MKKNSKKKFKVEFSDDSLKKINNLPDNAYNKLCDIVKGLKSGKLNPKTLGKPLDWIDLKIKLICPRCKSKEVEWLLDKNSNEVDFHCLNCMESFWMTYKEYKKAVKRNPDKVVGLNASQ